jgi:hypothetical protein
MLEGIEMSQFQGTEMKPYLESLRLLNGAKSDVYFTLGGTAEGRLWEGKPWEKKWIQPITSPIRHIHMWTEDMYGDRHLYYAEALMHACLLWRKRPKEAHYQDPLEREYVVEFDGNSGIWFMGGVKDFSGGMEKKTYEVAVRSMSQSYSKVWSTLIPYIAYVQVSASEFLAGDDGVLFNASWDVMARGSRALNDDALWEPSLTMYKRIRPENYHHTPLRFQLLLNTRELEGGQVPVTIRRTKLVLHLRRVPDLVVA